jgi:hypothetical protein
MHRWWMHRRMPIAYRPDHRSISCYWIPHSTAAAGHQLTRRSRRNLHAALAA